MRLPRDAWHARSPRCDRTLEPSSRGRAPSPPRGPPSGRTTGM